MEKCILIKETNIPVKPSQDDKQSSIWAKQDYKWRGTFEEWKQQYAKHYSQ